ncbi:hypothetical protein ACP4OV_020633 [Aristida adscensionis]
MADAGVTVVLAKLREVASAEVTALLKVDDQIRELRRGLGYLQAEVRGADQQRRGVASELLLLWAREARGVTFDVEDTVDEFHLKVEAFQLRAKRRGHAWSRSAVKLLNGLAMQVFVRHGLSREIAKINERINEISQIKKSYNLQSNPSKHWSLPSIDSDAVWDTDRDSTELRKDEFRKLKEEIMNPGELAAHHQGRVNISIILGKSSGTGKTRLARRLYSDHDIREKFEVFTWIFLPPRIRFQQYLEIILGAIRPQVKDQESGPDPEATAESSSPETSDETESSELKKLLKGRKYLVVLDGLVDIGNWNCLLDELPGDKPESRILITTQLAAEEVMHTDPKIKTTVLEPLDEGQTTKLFCERVFGAAPPPPWLVLEALLDSARKGSGIVASCSSSDLEVARDFSKRVLSVTRGLPLAVIVLGGILRTKAYPSEWREVFTEKLETSMHEAKALRCLWLLAFDELPNHLKACFLYLATASENILLDPARMVRLWVAEGFVAPSAGQTLEEVGLGYLKELICRGLVDLVDRDARGGIKTVAVHSLIHSFVQAEAQESSFVKIHHNAGVLNPHAVRRLAIHNFVDPYVDIPDSFPKLRSLHCDFLEEEKKKPSTGARHGAQEERDGGAGRGAATDTPVEHLGWPQPWWPWKNPAECLLQACRGSADGATAGTTKLHQLSIIRGSRFLRVIDLYGLRLERVPDEIGSIIHLRYLGIRNCELSGLPASISELDNLQTLDVRKTKVHKVTNEFWEILGLRHVLTDGLELPKCPSGHLKQLQTLTGVKPTEEWPSPSKGCSPLNHMIYLRSLAVCDIPNKADVVEAVLSALQKMEFLVSLSLSGKLLPSGVFTNPSSRRLEELELDGKLDSPPQGPFILPNLSKLTLSNLGLGNLAAQAFLDNVAAVPKLAEMELLDESYDAEELVFREGGFPSLMKLTLNNLANLENLELAPESKTVVLICGCPKLNKIPKKQLLSPSFQANGHELEESKPSGTRGVHLIFGNVINNFDRAAMRRSFSNSGRAAMKRIGRAAMVRSAPERRSVSNSGLAAMTMSETAVMQRSAPGALVGVTVLFLVGIIILLFNGSIIFMLRSWIW